MSAPRRRAPRGAAKRSPARRAPTRVALRIDVPAKSLPVPAAALRRLVARAVELTGFPGRLSVAVVDDPAMRVLNREFHGCDEPTDVLAFALDRPADGTGGRGSKARAAEAFDAEIAVSIDTARLEAADRGVPLVSELLLYVVHGTLHVLGEDDHDPAAYRRMHALALSILAALGHSNTIDPPEAKLGRRPGEDPTS